MLRNRFLYYSSLVREHGEKEKESVQITLGNTVLGRRVRKQRKARQGLSGCDIARSGRSTVLCRLNNNTY